VIVIEREVVTIREVPSLSGNYRARRVLRLCVDTDHKSLNAVAVDNASATPFMLLSQAQNGVGTRRLREGNRVPRAGRNLKPSSRELND